MNKVDLGRIVRFATEPLDLGFKEEELPSILRFIQTEPSCLLNMSRNEQEWLSRKLSSLKNRITFSNELSDLFSKVECVTKAVLQRPENGLEISEEMLRIMDPKDVVQFVLKQPNWVATKLGKKFVLGIAGTLLSEKKSDGSHLEKFIVDFICSIEDEDERKEIVKASVLKNRGLAECVAKHFKELKVSSLNVVVEISNSLNDKTSRCELIKEYLSEFEDPKEIIKRLIQKKESLIIPITKILTDGFLTEQDLTSVIRFVLNNKFVGEEFTMSYLIDLIHLIKSEEVHIDLLPVFMSFVIKHKRIAIKFSKTFHTWKISDESKRIEVAERISDRYPGLISCALSKFSIQDREALKKLAFKEMKGEWEDIIGFKSLSELDKFFPVEERKDPDYKSLCLYVLSSALLEETMSCDVVKLIERGVLPPDISLNGIDVAFHCLNECRELYFLDSGISSNEDSLILSSIEKIRDKTFGFQLMQIFHQELKQKDFAICYRKFAPVQRKKDGPVAAHKLLAGIFLGKWLRQVQDQAVLDKSIGALNTFLNTKREDFRSLGLNLLTTLLLAEKTLDERAEILPARKIDLLALCCRAPSAREVKESLNSLQILCIRGVSASLDLDELSKDPLALSKKLSDLVENSLREDSFFGLQGLANLTERYKETFGCTRVPIAIEVYRGRLEGCESSVKEAFQLFVRGVFTGTYSQERYQLDGNVHLQAVEKSSPGILKEWQKPDDPLPVTLSIGPELQQRSLDEFFKDKCIHGHWEKEGKDLLPELTAFVNGSLIDRERVFLESADEKQSLCMRLLMETDRDKQSHLVELAYKALGQAIPEGIEWMNDLKGLLEAAVPSKQSNLTVVDTDHWEDLFLSGTEVAGSCQRIDAPQETSKCLLAYCLDGKNRMIAIKEVDGKIVARSMFRLLFDVDKSTPVLFLDVPYPHPCPPAQIKILLDHAKRRAAVLGLPLFTAWSSEGVLDLSHIVSLGSSCPYEYADSAKKIFAGPLVMPRGEFSIKEPRMVW